MTNIATRKLGSSRATVSTLGFGSAPLGELFEPVGEEQAQQTLAAAWDAGIRYYDTSPFYGSGKSEQRVGYFLRQQARDEFVLSTKVGRVFKASRDPENFQSHYWPRGLKFDHVFDYS